MDNLILLLDGARGIYIPQTFAEDFLDGVTTKGYWTGVDPEAVEILKAGPDHELYWETWEQVLNNAEWIETATEEAYRLHQDGDLWAYKVSAAEAGELDEFFGE